MQHVHLRPIFCKIGAAIPCVVSGPLGGGYLSTWTLGLAVWLALVNGIIADVVSVKNWMFCVALALRITFSCYFSETAVCAMSKAQESLRDNEIKALPLRILLLPWSTACHLPAVLPSSDSLAGCRYRRDCSSGQPSLFRPDNPQNNGLNKVIVLCHDVLKAVVM